MSRMTEADVSERNDSATPRIDTGKIRGICSGPVRYELIDKDGKIRVNGRWLCTDCNTHFPILEPNGRCGCGSGRVIGKGFDTATEAAEWATRFWPDQSQDPDRTGRGWDVQVVGAK